MRHLAKIGFTQSYTYFTWKNSRWELTEYVSELALHRRERLLPPELLREHAGHPARVPPARRPRRVRGPADPRRHAQPELRHLLRLRALRERPGTRRLGGVPELREVRDQAARARRPDAAPASSASTQIRRDNAALHDLTNITFLDTANDALIAYAKQSPGNDDHHRRQHRPPPGPGGPRDRARQSRSAAELHRPRPAHRRALPVAHRSELRPARARRPSGARRARGDLETR